MGGKWQKIARYLQGRPPEAVKNRYYSVIRKKQQSDPDSSLPSSSSGLAHDQQNPSIDEIDAMLNLTDDSSDISPSVTKSPGNTEAMEVENGD
jgi:hypothetical protein